MFIFIVQNDTISMHWFTSNTIGGALSNIPYPETWMRSLVNVMEFVSVRAWVFGEVKVIQKPISACAPSPKPLDIMDTAMTVDNDRMEPTPSMSQTTQKKPVTENVLDKQQSLIKSCVVSIEPLKGPDSVTVGILSNNGNGYNMHNRPPEPQLAHQTSEYN